jgi:UDP-N-acetylglucosamine 4,6-dehydratase
MFIVKPPETLWERGLQYEGDPLPEGYRYSSDTNSQWLDVDGIREFVAPFEKLFAEGKLEG